MSPIVKLNFEITSNPEYLIVKIEGLLDNDNSKVFQENFPHLLVSPPLDVIMDFTKVSDLSNAWVRQLVSLQSSLKSAKKQLRLIGLNENLQKYLRREGVDSVLRMCVNLKTALVELKIATAPTFDVNFINPFLTATMKALETQASTKAKPGKLYKKSAGDKLSGDISGVIGMVGEKFTGSIVVSFPETTYCKIISRMLGEEYHKISKEIEDGAGEVTNIIFGHARALLNDQGYGIKMALPSVVSSTQNSDSKPPLGARIVIPFATDVGDFFVEISLAA